MLKKVILLFLFSFAFLKHWTSMYTNVKHFHTPLLSQMYRLDLCPPRKDLFWLSCFDIFEKRKHMHVCLHAFKHALTHYLLQHLWRHWNSAASQILLLTWLLLLCFQA